MNLRKEFNRIGHLLHDGADKTQQAAGDWADRGSRHAARLARQVRRQVDSRSVNTAEERLVQHVRDNPAMYLIGAAVIILALTAKLLLRTNQELDETHRIPLL